MQKTNFKTRLLALLTAVFMVVMCVPFAAFADVETIHVTFTDDGKVVKTVDITASSNEKAPELPDGYYWKTNLSSDGVSDLNSKDPIDFKDLAKANCEYAGFEKVKKPAPTTKTVYVSYILESGAPLDAEIEKIELKAGATTFSTSLLKKVPAGYELCEDGDVYIGTSDTVNVKVREAKKTVFVSYILENGEPLANAIEQIELAAGATTFSTSLLKKVPAGYELCEDGDVYIGTSDTVNVKVREAKKTVFVSYILENGEPLANAIEQIELAAGATTFSTSLLKKVPAGYELCETGDVYIGTSDTVNVKVREAKKPAKVVYVSYILESGEPLANAIEKIELENGATTFSTSLLKKVPAGYELCETGDVYIGTSDTVNVKVREAKKPAKVVYVSYILESGEPLANAIEKIELENGATTFNTSVLKQIPVGYELCETGDVYIGENDTVNVKVRKPAEPAVKEVKINFYCPEEKKQVAEPTVVVNADATCVNSSAYASMVPAGYELVEVGDMPIRDGYVYAEVRKVATKTIKINYYSEEEEKQIAEVEMTVPADATYVNTSALTAPAGYELVLAGDLPIRDGYVYAAVRKVPTTTIKISYVDEATDKEVGTEDLVVNQGSTVVNFNVLKSVPAGYELCESGDFYVGNGSAKVMVRKTKSNNGSSSSTSSSSSNKTTTASSKAEQKVVKAAAAPANTTKVLPKTGASNVAPLLGGSLAVVALLMGYGIYSLVLRKKD